LLAAGALAALPRAGHPERQRLVGFLSQTSAEYMEPFHADIRRGLDETGYVEGRNLVIEYRWADGDYARLPGLAVDLVRNNVEVITAVGGTQSAMVAMQATATIPIVAASAAPLVRHFNRPEGNVTGVEIVTGDLTPKRLQILSEIVPGMAIGIVMNPASAFYDRDQKRIEDAARALGVKVDFVSISGDPDFDPAFASLSQKHVGAVLPDAEPFLGSRGQLLVTLAARYGIPIMSEWREDAAGRGLISYGPQHAWVYHQVGRYTGQILNGAKPADLPVVAPTKFELVINLKTARSLGLTIPPALLDLADEVIE
jgi:putative ABC transport system substrate-binding protein